MLEINRIHALLAFNRTSGLPVGLDEYYRVRLTGRLVRGGGPPSSRGSL